MRATTKRKLKAIVSPFYRLGLKNKSFTILSNNCWGGFYYDRYHLPYLTPTIGLFFPPKDYIKFLKNLDYYLSLDPVQISLKESHFKNEMEYKQKMGWLENIDQIVIGKIDDVEIIFLHYPSFAVAKEKWNKRKLRINKDNMIVKFNDQNGFEIEDYFNFIKLDYNNKIFFTSNKDLKDRNYVYFEKKYVNSYGFIFDDFHTKFNFKRYVNNIKKDENV